MILNLQACNCKVEPEIETSMVLYSWKYITFSLGVFLKICSSLWSHCMFCLSVQVITWKRILYQYGILYLLLKRFLKPPGMENFHRKTNWRWRKILKISFNDFLLQKIVFQKIMGKKYITFIEKSFLFIFTPCYNNSFDINLDIKIIRKALIFRFVLWMNSSN